MSNGIQEVDENDQMAERLVRWIGCLAPQYCQSRYAVFAHGERVQSDASMKWDPTEEVRLAA